ncbi:hypothetical protein [Apilactobacillus apinorum]|uniref:S-layer protein n=1 Tax=Apilactobacillus apinorum TaxID=1218495 RepID=A0ABP9ZG91_9LACO
MQSSLKKSLYLGLAALTFASVAGASVSATSTNANAAKHAAKKVAKKVTYKTTDSKLDQSVVYVSTGKNAVYSKPGTVKGAKVVASKATMASLANTKSVSAQFMAYQEATTSKGAKYLKVVSFDKKIRGYVYVGGVQKAQGTASAKASYNFTNANNLYLKTPRVFDKAYGSEFGAKLVKFDSNVVYKNTKFTADDAVTNANGDVYFHVTANTINSTNPNALVAFSGWVNAKNLTTTPDEAYSDKAVTVNYINAANGSTVYTKVVPINTAYNANVNGSSSANAWSGETIRAAVEQGLGTYTAANGNTPASFTVASGSNYDANLASYYAASNYNNYSVTTKGASLNVYVSKNDAQSTPVAFNFSTESVNANTGAVSADQTSKISKSANVFMSDKATKLSDYKFDTVAAGLNGISSDNFSYNKVVNNLFADGKAFNTIFVKNDDGSFTTYKFDANATRAANSTLVNTITGADVTGVNFSAVSTFNVVYVQQATQATATSVVTLAGTTTNSNVKSITINN